MFRLSAEANDAKTPFRPLRVRAAVALLNLIGHVVSK